MTIALGPQLQAFIEGHLKGVKHLQPASIRSYRDALRLFLTFIAGDMKRRITQLTVNDLTFERFQRFLRYMEEGRGNHARTLNHRLAVLRTFFDYLASVNPQLLPTSQKVASIPVKRGIPPRMSHIEREEILSIFRNLPRKGRNALRDGTLVLFLYNTGAGVQQVADLRIDQLDLGPQPKVILDGKGNRRRTCPLWSLTARSLEKLIGSEGIREGSEPLFASRQGIPLTRFGIYKIVRRHAGTLESAGSSRRPIRPQVFRSAAPARLDSELEGVIKSWLAAAAEDGVVVIPKAPEIRGADARPNSNGTAGATPWKDDGTLLAWLNSL